MKLSSTINEKLFPMFKASYLELLQAIMILNFSKADYYHALLSSPKLTFDRLASDKVNTL